MKEVPIIQKPVYCFTEQINGLVSIWLGFLSWTSSRMKFPYRVEYTSTFLLNISKCWLLLFLSRFGEKDINRVGFHKLSLTRKHSTKVLWIYLSQRKNTSSMNSAVTAVRLTKIFRDREKLIFRETLVNFCLKNQIYISIAANNIHKRLNSKFDLFCNERKQSNSNSSTPPRLSSAFPDACAGKIKTTTHFIRKLFIKKWASKTLKHQMLKKSPASNVWVAIFQNANFSQSFLKFAELSTF